MGTKETIDLTDDSILKKLGSVIGDVPGKTDTFSTMHRVLTDSAHFGP